MSDDLVAKWLDDRRSLTEEEALDLHRALSSDPELARRVKDQLATDDLLSRRLAVDRRNFGTQMAQRLSSPSTDREFTESTLAAARRAGRRRWGWLPEAAAAALLLVGLLVLLRRTPDGGTPAAGPSGLRAEYFRSRDLRGPASTRRDPSIDFEWLKGTGPFEGWRDVFSARWTGRIVPRYSERYTFRAQYDDGVRVWIDGALVIDDWKGRYVVGENRSEVALQAGKPVDLRVEYFNGGDLGLVRLYWSSPSQREEIIPADRLTPD